MIIPLHGPAAVTESPGGREGRVAGIPLDYTEVGHCPQATPEGVPRVAPEGAASLLSLEPLGQATLSFLSILRAPSAAASATAIGSNPSSLSAHPDIRPETPNYTFPQASCVPTLGD